MSIKKTSEGVQMQVKAIPNSSKDAVVGLVGDYLKIKVQAPPEDGKANKSICKLLAKELGIKQHQIVVIQGETSQKKSILFQDVSLEAVKLTFDLQ